MSTLGTAASSCKAGDVSPWVVMRGTFAARSADYLQIVKPRISLLVLLTVAAGFALAPAESWSVLSLLHALGGIALVATSSSAWNQILERQSDRQMLRTQDRPLPANRLSVSDVFWFGLGTGVGGIAWLAFAVNAATACMAFMTLAVYAGVYTPLKKRTSLATAVGAVPGAMPPVLGWMAAGAPLDWQAFSLFGILFLWQFPHFLAIAWIYRDEYSRARLKMLPAGGQVRYLTGILAVAYALALIPISFLPAACGLAGGAYAGAALVMGLGYVFASIRFARSESYQTARGLLLTSLVYLPVILGMLVWNHFELLK
jgi:heme o synthase